MVAVCFVVLRILRSAWHVHAAVVDIAEGMSCVPTIGGL